MTTICPALVRTAMSELGDDPGDVAAEELRAVDDRGFAVVPTGWSTAIAERRRGWQGANSLRCPSKPVSHDVSTEIATLSDMITQVKSANPTLQQVLSSASRLQEVVPDAVLVGGSAAALHAGHRDSFDHYHVLADLVDRYEAVLDAVESTEGWATSVRASRPPVAIMGSLGGIEAGLRQMRRTRPLETTEVDLGEGRAVVAPTEPEALRVKAYLVVQRNVVRDYLDVVALAEHLGSDQAVATLSDIDAFYDDRSGESGSVLTSLVIALADPNPLDTDVIDELPRYKGLDPRWHQWSDVVAACQALALRLGGAA